MSRESTSPDRLAALTSGSERLWVVVALLAVLLFAFQAGPGHADIYDTSGPAAASSHFPGDGHDGQETGHAGIHCASHCGGHAAATPDRDGMKIPMRRGAGAYGQAADAAPAGRDEEPPTPPPTA